MAIQRCLLVRNTRPTESLVIHFPFLFLLRLGSDLVGVHPETWPLHISVQNYFRFVLIELNTLWFALNSCHSMSTRSIKMSCNCSCFSSKYYRTPLWGLRKRVTGSSEFVTGTNHHILSQCFVFLQWDVQEHQDMVASAGSSPRCTSSTDVTSPLRGCKEQELSNARIAKATFISLLPLLCSQ